jgi:hypothetical protein
LESGKYFLSTLNPESETLIQLESGEYFLSTAAKKEKKAAERSEDKKKEKEDRDKERAAVFVAPKEGKKKKRRADEVLYAVPKMIHLSPPLCIHILKDPGPHRRVIGGHSLSQSSADHMNIIIIYIIIIIIIIPQPGSRTKTHEN